MIVSIPGTCTCYVSPEYGFSSSSECCFSGELQNNSGQSLPVEVTAGSRATDIRELRQARKGAAVTVLDVCRGSAWLSLVPAILMVSQNIAM